MNSGMRPSPDPMSSMWAWLAYDLRLYRMRARMNQEELGKVLGCVKSTVSRLESGGLQIDEKQAALLDTLWNTNGHFSRLLAYARRAHDPDWIKQHSVFEARAIAIKTYEALLVPGLLQTPEYARVALSEGMLDDVDGFVDARMRRQEILRRPRPPRLWVLIDEGVVDRPVGGAGVMRAQLAHLLAEGECPHISIRVVPRKAGLHVGLDGSFEILCTDRGDVGYAEAQLGGRLVMSRDEVSGLKVRYDQIGVRALPEDLTRYLIRRHMEAMS